MIEIALLDSPGACPEVSFRKSGYGKPDHATLERNRPGKPAPDKVSIPDLSSAEDSLWTVDLLFVQPATSNAVESARIVFSDFYIMSNSIRVSLAGPQHTLHAHTKF